MPQGPRFRFLTREEFAELSTDEKVAYLAEAIEEIRKMHHPGNPDRESLSSAPAPTRRLVSPTDTPGRTGDGPGSSHPQSLPQTTAIGALPLVRRRMEAPELICAGG